MEQPGSSLRQERGLAAGLAACTKYLHNVGMENLTRVYSYRRFSSGRQATGHSLERQTALAREWCQEHGLRLDDTLAMSDLGVSAFSGKNANQGALSVFLKAVKENKVPTGSILLVESLDRLSRNAIPEAVNLLTLIVRSGVRVVSMIDRKEWNNETINDSMNFLLSVLLFSRAHEESATKSKRVRAAVMKKREAGLPVIFGGHGPGWASPREDRQGWLLDEVKAASVKKVFDMAIAGHGGITISRTANQEKWPLPWRVRANTNTRWEHTGVSRILRDRRVLGEWQPKRMLDGQLVFDGDIVKGYFPQIISEETWYLAQDALANRTGPKRLRGLKSDIFSGILYCKCGERLDRKAPTKRGYARYYCLGRSAGVSSCEPLSEAALIDDALRTLVRSELSSFSPDLLATQTRNALATAEIQHEELSLRVSKLLDALEESGHNTLILRRFEELEREQTKIATTIATYKAELSSISVDKTAFTEDFVKAVSRAVKDRGAVEERHRMSTAISRAVTRITWRSPYLEFRLKSGPAVHQLVHAPYLQRAKRKDRKAFD